MAAKNNPQYVQAGQSFSGCPGTAGVSGYYEYGSSTPVIQGYLNPSTSKPWTPTELSNFVSGGTTATTGGTTPAAPASNYTPMPGHPGFNATPEEHAAAQEEYISGGWGSGVTGTTPTTPTTTPATTPTFGEGAAAGIPTPAVTPAPPYEISPAQTAFEEMYSGKLTDWVENPQGIPEETQALMIQQQTDSLKARETESIRVMRNNMERRGITNSGFTFSNEQAIRSNTTVAIAGAIADVQINSALMKMASFEKAMGAAGQFLGYLSEQSQLKYAPEFATWQAEQMATMQVWQGKMDLLKMEINQAYQTQNMQLEAELTSQLNTQQHAWDIELAEMEIEANQKAATAQGIGSIFGTVLGFIFGK